MTHKQNPPIHVYDSNNVQTSLKFVDFQFESGLVQDPNNYHQQELVSSVTPISPSVTPLSRNNIFTTQDQLDLQNILYSSCSTPLNNHNHVEANIYTEYNPNPRQSVTSVTSDEFDLSSVSSVSSPYSVNNDHEPFNKYTSNLPSVAFYSESSQKIPIEFKPTFHSFPSYPNHANQPDHSDQLQLTSSLKFAPSLAPPIPVPVQRHHSLVNFNQMPNPHVITEAYDFPSNIPQDRFPAEGYISVPTQFYSNQEGVFPSGYNTINLAPAQHCPQFSPYYPNFPIQHPSSAPVSRNPSVSSDEHPSMHTFLPPAPHTTYSIPIQAHPTTTTTTTTSTTTTPQPSSAYTQSSAPVVTRHNSSISSESSFSSSKPIQLDRNGRKPRVWRKRTYKCNHCNLVFPHADLASFAKHIRDLEYSFGVETICRKYKCTEKSCEWHYIGFTRKLEREKHFKRRHGRPDIQCSYWAGEGKEAFPGAKPCSTRWHTDCGNKRRHEIAVHGEAWTKESEAKARKYQQELKKNGVLRQRKI